MSAPPALFDCDTCVANRDHIAQLEAENRWLRRHVQPPACDRCRGGGSRLTYVERFGFHVSVCSECWRPGDRLRMRNPRRTDPAALDMWLRVVTPLELVVEHPDGDTRIICDYGERQICAPHWAIAWTATGLVNHGPEPGSGVMCRTEAVRFVVDQLGQR